MQHRIEFHSEESSKRQKIEEETSKSFWKWYIPHSGHPKRAASEMPKTFFRFDAAYALYCKLVKRKWHNRWYMIEILKVSPHQMYTFEILRGQGAFQHLKIIVNTPAEYWEQ